MPVGRLTQKASTVIIKLGIPQNTNGVPKKTTTAGTVVKELAKSAGYGGQVLSKFPELKIITTKRVELNALVLQAYYQASKLAHPYVGTEHLLLALLKLCNSKDYRKVYDHISSTSMFPKALKMVSTARDSIILDTFGNNLNADILRLYREPLVFREELNHLSSILLKKDNNNALIIGETGVGKDSLIQLLVRSIVSLDVPPVLAGYQVIEFDLMSYVTSVANKGSIENTLLNLQDELRGLKRVIVSVKNLQNLFISTSAGVGVPLIYTMFRDALRASGVSFIATMNTSVFERLNVDNDYLFDGFSVIELAEPEDEEVQKMLKLKAKALGEFHNVTISDNVVEYVYELAKDEITTPSFPKKGVDLLDIACANLLVKKSAVPGDYKKLVDKTVDILEDLDRNLAKGKYDEALKLEAKMVSVDKVLVGHEDAMIFSKPLKLGKTDIRAALEEMDYIKEQDEKADTKTLSGLADEIKKKVVGQDAAVDTVVKALIRAKLGLRQRKRPMGSFLFLGPTGVGKTELARVLGEKSNLIRLDMSDFSEKHTVARLVGAPPGYVGYGEGGELTAKIAAHPESVVLFDEIEKAHPDVLNILLQIMEEGELADAKGATHDFSKSVVILTSNIGTEILHNKEIGFVEGLKLADDARVSAHLKLNLKKILKPELLNRFDEIIVFRRLGKEDQLKVLDIMLAEVAEGLKAQKVSLRISKAVKQQLLQTGYSDEYGARSLRRVVEKDLLDKVAQILLIKKKRPLKLSAGVEGGSITVKTPI